MDTLQFTPRGLQVTGCRCARGNDDGIVPRDTCYSGDIIIVFERYAFSFEQTQPAVYDGLVQLEVWDAIAQQATCRLVLLEDGHLIAHQVQGVGGSQACRTGTDDSHLSAISHDVCVRLNISFAEGGLDDGTLVLAVCRRFVVEAVQHAGFLAQGRTDATRELGEGIGTCQQPVGQFPVSLIEGIVPFGSLVAQRTGPVAEGYAAVHAAACLQLTFARVKRLLHLTEIVDSIVNRTVSCLLAVYL